MAITMLLIVCIYLFFKSGDVPNNPAVAQLVNLEVDRVVKKIDKHGFDHAIINDLDNVIQSTSQLDAQSKLKLDSVLDLLDIKEKQLVTYANYNASLKAQLLHAHQSDTSYFYHDNALRIEYIKPVDFPKQGYFNFQYEANINHAQYWERSWLLGPKKHYIDFWVDDTRVSIQSVQRVRIDQSKPRAKLSVHAQAFYNSTDQKVYMGPSVDFSYGKIGLSGSYLYEKDAKNKSALMSLKYRFLAID